ncbi:MAG TPA: thioredoxin-like domain-containing protein [Pirellulales bacterium]|nr:thioredoxin-like domain-containing protein [Pirellulales bacterium]
MKNVDSPGRLARGLGGILALAALLLSGCPGQSSTGTGHRGDELLEQVQQAYQQARSYADAAELVVESQSDGKKRMAPFSVSFFKPDKLRIEAYDASIVCDGKNLWSAIANEHLVGQVLYLPAPAEMSLEALYHEPMIKSALGGDDAGLPMPQLELLLANQPLKRLFGNDVTTKWLGEKSLSAEEPLYHVVEVTGSQGTFVLWVDPKTHVLRRLETTGANGPEKLLVTIDFKGAKLDGSIAENAFKFETPATAKLVSRFVLPPAELDDPPSELLGQQPGAFKFIDGEGNPVDAASLDGRVVVLDMWALSCHYCFESFPNLEKVYRQYRDNPKVAILTVNNVDVDGTDSSLDTLRETFAKKGLDLPILRDPERYSESVFKVPGWPTMIVLGTDGSVQAYEIGYNAKLAETLPKKIDQLLAGENLADETLANYRRVRADFERHLDEATVGVNRQIELPRAKIAQRSEPEKLKIEKLWSTSDVKNPGNIVVFPDAEGVQRIAVFDGWRAIVELDGAGKTLARHELDLPADGAATHLRTAVDGQGRRAYAAFAVGQRKVYLMDDAWKMVGSFPEETRQGISDIQLADLDGDGQLEMLVGYLGEVGVQCASLAPQRMWANRAFDNVLSLAVPPRDADGHCRILVGNERTAVGVLDYAGTQLADIPVAKRPIDIIVVADLGGRTDRTDPADSEEHELWKLAALSAMGPAELIAVGLDFHGGEQWSYPFPIGVRNTPCDPLLAGHLRAGSTGQWLLTGADGSIHMLTAEGQLLDRFQYGDELTGIGTTMADGEPILLVSTAHGLTAWKVSDGDSMELDAPDAGAQARKPEKETSDAPDLGTETSEPPTESGQ